MTYDRELRTEAAHALTHNSEVWADRGYAVVTAGGLSEGDTDFELDVGPYDVLVGDTDETSVGPTTLSVNAPDSDPYWLVVYVDGEGLQTEQGPEGEVFVGDQSVVASNADVREITSPAPPTLADIGPVTVLGKVLVTSGGVSNSLIDDRVFQSERVFDSVDARSASVEEQSIANIAGLVFKDEDQTISSGSITDVEFEVVDREDADIVQWNDELHQFEIQKDGLFLLRATLGFDSWVDGSRYRFRIDMPSGPDAANEDRDKRGDEQFEKPLSVITPLSEGDVVTANVFQDTGGDLTIRGDRHSANLQIARLA